MYRIKSKPKCPRKQDMWMCCRVQVSPSSSPLHHLFLWAGPPPCDFHRTGGCVCFGRHESTKRGRGGAHLSIPALIPSLRGSRRGLLSRRPPRLVPAWMAETGGLASPSLCTWHSSRMSPLTRQQIGFECT